MYLNPYQKYISELLGEYGPLLSRQLLEIVNWRFKKRLCYISGYINQMCMFGNYETEEVSGDILLAPTGMRADFDLIRAFDVMLEFKNSLVHHRRSREPAKICFIITTMKHDKEITVIPVHQGKERELSHYVDDKFSGEKCEVAMFLLDKKEQIKALSPKNGCKIAVYDKDGIDFYTK